MLKIKFVNCEIDVFYIPIIYLFHNSLNLTICKKCSKELVKMCIEYFYQDDIFPNLYVWDKEHGTKYTLLLYRYIIFQWN